MFLNGGFKIAYNPIGFGPVDTLAAILGFTFGDHMWTLLKSTRTLSSYLSVREKAEIHNIKQNENNYTNQLHQESRAKSSKSMYCK